MTAGEGAAPCSPSARAGAEARSGDLEVDAGERACACSQRCAEATAAVGWWVGGGGGASLAAHICRWLIHSWAGKLRTRVAAVGWLRKLQAARAGRQATIRAEGKR